MNIDASLYSFDRVRAFNDAEIKKQLQYMFVDEDIDVDIIEWENKLEEKRSVELKWTSGAL